MSTENKEPRVNATQKSSVNRRDVLKGLAAAAATAGGAVNATSAAEPGATLAQGVPRNPYGGKPNTGITLPPYYRPMPSVDNANTLMPRTEKLGEDEMRISFIGSTPVTRDPSGLQP